MPAIMSSKNLWNTGEISKLAYREQKPIFSLDQAIYESEKEMSEGGETIELDEVFERLNEKYYG